MVLSHPLNKFKTADKEVIIMSAKKEFVEPVLERYEEKLDEVTKGVPVGSCPEDFGTPT